MSVPIQGPHPNYAPFASRSSHVSSRSSYPSFLSVQDTLYLQLKWAWRGLHDASRWNVVAATTLGDPEIRASVYKSLLLNFLSLISIFTFELILSPLVETKKSWFHRNIGWFYQVLWLFPIVGVSFYLNSSWCSTIAKRTFALQHGNRANQQPVTYSGMLTAIATSAYRIIMVINSLGFSFILKSIPYIGTLVSFLFLCWVDAYYCFEFVWIARGQSLSRRIRYLEERWAYFLAFGFPSAALCTFGTGLANGAIFALVFPAYIILAMDAQPVPPDPYNPVPSSGTDHEVTRHPSPFVPIRLPIFALVMWMNDRVVWLLSVGPVRGLKQPTVRNRVSSDAAESVEEGSAATAGFATPRQTTSPRPQVRPARDRINIGRRKVD